MYAGNEEELEDDGMDDIDSEEQSKRDSYGNVMLGVSSGGNSSLHSSVGT